MTGHVITLDKQVVREYEHDHVAFAVNFEIKVAAEEGYMTN